MKFSRYAACAAMGSLLLAGQVAAGETAVARVVDTQGDVRVSQGQGLAKADSNAALRPGDRVVAADGAARLRYADGCVVSVAPKAVATIGERSPCTSQGLINAPQTMQVENPGVHWFMTGLAAVFAVFVFTEVMDDDDDDDAPVSP